MQLINVIRWIAAATFFAISSACPSAEPPTNWSAVPEILSRIKETRFADREFVITNFGAARDGKTDCKPALDTAIAACTKAGGGRVLIPAGEWLVRGPIHLKSNVHLHVEKGATVRFSPDPADYLPAVPTRFEGNEVIN